jgi:hypothetical protein
VRSLKTLRMRVKINVNALRLPVVPMLQLLMVHLMNT